MDYDRVKTRAYFIWVNSGYQDGRELYNWVEAEALESAIAYAAATESTCIFTALQDAVKSRPDYDPNAKLEPATLAQPYRDIDRADLEKIRVQSPLPINDSVAAHAAFANYDSNNTKDTVTALNDTPMQEQVPEPLKPRVEEPVAPKKSWWKKLLGM